MIDNPVDIILTCIELFLVVWVALALSFNIRDVRKRKRLQQARRQHKASETAPVEQVIRLAEWKMEHGMTERESHRYGQEKYTSITNVKDKDQRKRSDP